MSSLCVFEMKITGLEPDVQKLLDVILCTDKSKKHFGCLEDTYMSKYRYDPISKISTVVVGGASKYSAEYGMLGQRYSNFSHHAKEDSTVTCLEKETRDKEIFIEIFSQNDEDEFQEYIFIEKGYVTINEVRGITVHNREVRGGFESMGEYMDCTNRICKINNGVIEIYL